MEYDVDRVTDIVDGYRGICGWQGLLGFLCFDLFVLSDFGAGLLPCVFTCCYAPAS